MTNYDRLIELGIECRNISGNQKVVCPFCSSSRKNKRDRSLSVDVVNGLYNCHHCSTAGSVAVYEPKKEYIKPAPELRQLGQSVIDWFASRGITSYTLQRYKITEGVDYMPQVGSEVRTIHFNYFYNEELLNIKYRDRDKNFKLVSGAILLPYGIDVALDNSADVLVICEGEIDVLSLYEAGIKNAVSVPNGASKGSQKLEWLEEFYHVFEGKKIIIATDMDEAGISLRNELARRLGKDRCRIMEMPYKDANETLLNDGKDKLIECYNNAKAFPIEGIDDASSVYTDLMALYEQGVPKGYSSGWDMDTDWIVQLGQVNLITGIPGHGKSTWLKNLVYRLADRHGLKSFIYSAEEANTAFAISDLLQIATGKTFFESPKRITKYDIDKWMPFMQDHFKFYRMADNDMTIESIIEKGKQMVKQFGVNIMVIDNMSTVEKSMSKESDTRHHQIKNMLNDVASFARAYDVAVFLVAHPKKMQELKAGIYRVPNGYDVGDSSHWYNLADNGITVYRNFQTGQSEIHRWKVRFKHSGKVGTSYFKFKIDTGVFESTEKVNDGSDTTKFVGQSYEKEFTALPNPF